MTTPIHLQPSAPLAERVLLPGDPGRALRLAQDLLEEPKMFNHNRGLWGYTGRASDGELLTVQSTGMGGPSSAIVIWELLDLGARRLVRVGTCGGLRDDLGLGDLIVADEAIADDGASRSLGAGERVAASDALFTALSAAGEPGGGRDNDGPDGEARRLITGAVVSTDLFYGAEERESAWREAGAIAVEMEAATLFTLAARRGVEAGCALLVSDLLAGKRDRIADQALAVAELALGRLATRALI